jgi:Isochorismatase family
MLIGEETPLTLAPLSDQVGGGTWVLGLLVHRYPVRSGQQLKAIRSLEPVDQLRYALVALQRLGVVAKEDLCLLRTRTAIVVVDMVGDMFIPSELTAQRDNLVTTINKLLAHAREAGHSIVWVRQELAEDLSDAPLQFRRHQIQRTIGGTPGAMLLPEIDSVPGDTEIIKKRYSAFLEQNFIKIYKKKVYVASSWWESTPMHVFG